jgi:hypothetical protein
MNTTRNLFATIVALAFLAACGGGDKPNPVEPPPVISTGTATFSISAAPETLGAIRLRVFGPGMSNPIIRGGAKVIAQRTVADTTTLLLSLKSGAGAFLDVSLSNRDRAPSVLVQEATADMLDGYRALAPSSVVVSTTIR